MGPFSRSSWWMLCLVAVAACGTDEVNPDSAPGPNQNVEPPPPVITNAVLREDFNTADLIDDAGDAVVDVNAGILTLPVRSLFATEAVDVVTDAFFVDTGGLIEGRSVFVRAGAAVDASDSIELRAAEEVRVSGRVSAGPGGITIVAGQRIIIEGELVSLGPISLQVVDAAGSIEVSGRVSTRASLDAFAPATPGIELVGRGKVFVSGEVVTTTAPDRAGGNIDIDVYGAVSVAGQIHTTAEPQGVPGRTQIRSSEAVEVVTGGLVGAITTEIGGEVIVEAAGIRVESGGRITAGQAGAFGSPVRLTASGTIDLAPNAIVTSGAGLASGDLDARARSITVGEGALLVGGHAVTQAGELRVEAVERMQVNGGAVVAGASTECGPGGTALITVGGPLLVAPTAQLRGGSSAALELPRTCSERHAGGSLRVQAREAEGLQSVLRPGFGIPGGEVTIDLAPDVAVDEPDLLTDVRAMVRSRVLDRGVAPLNFIPVLVELVADTPVGTRVEVGMSGSDAPTGPFTSTISLDAGDEALGPLRDKRYLRYHIELIGRTFDAPAVDYVEIRLRPSDDPR